MPGSWTPPGDRIGEAHALYGLGVVRHKEGRLDSAVTTLVHALELARRTGERLVEAKARYSLGAIELVRGDAPSAVAATSHLRDAVRLLSATGSPQAQRILRELTGSGSVPPAHDDDRDR